MRARDQRRKEAEQEREKAEQKLKKEAQAEFKRQRKERKFNVHKDKMKEVAEDHALAEQLGVEKVTSLDRTRHMDLAVIKGYVHNELRIHLEKKDKKKYETRALEAAMFTHSAKPSDAAVVVSAATPSETEASVLKAQ
jgi:phosphoenolpyruvate synthase/pyruvate phosphate dikinase